MNKEGIGMHYTVVLLADTKSGYTALVPALPGCLSEGDTVDETMDMVLDAISLYIESSEEHMEEVPIELPVTLIGQVDIESGYYWLKDVVTVSRIEKSFGSSNVTRSRKEIDAQKKVAAGTSG